MASSSRDSDVWCWKWNQINISLKLVRSPWIGSNGVVPMATKYTVYHGSCFLEDSFLQLHTRGYLFQFRSHVLVFGTLHVMVLVSFPCSYDSVLIRLTKCYIASHSARTTDHLLETSVFVNSISSCKSLVTARHNKRIYKGAWLRATYPISKFWDPL